MNSSEKINELAIALSSLQGEIQDMTKDKQGYGYSYADLSQILQISRPLLLKHKMAITQLTGSAHDKVTLETILMHASGQWISSTIEMAAEKGKNMSLAQAVGSVITYARRYSLAAILGITQKDDDASLNAQNGIESVKGSVKSIKISMDQEKNIRLLLGQDNERISNFLKWADLDSISSMEKGHYDEAVNAITRRNEKNENTAHN